MASILILERAKLLGRSLEEAMADEGHTVAWALSENQAREVAASQLIDLAIIECTNSNASVGLLISEITKRDPHAIIIAMLAAGESAQAVSSLKSGAAALLVKPLDLEIVVLTVRHWLARQKAARAWSLNLSERVHRYGLHRIVGDCPAMDKAKSLVRNQHDVSSHSAERPMPALISGEFGTGKRLFARTIHYGGPRRAFPYVEFDCAAIPESLVTSALFGGTEHGNDRPSIGGAGVIHVASGGTLVLFNVESLPGHVQQVLFDVIATGRNPNLTVRTATGADVQFIGVTRHDPGTGNPDHQLKSCLYHLLRTVHIELPPLRERGADLDTLLDRFIEDYGRQAGVAVKAFSESARARFRCHDWPGNVWELKTCVSRAVALSGNDVGWESAQLLVTADNLACPTESDNQLE